MSIWFQIWSFFCQQTFFRSSNFSSFSNLRPPCILTGDISFRDVRPAFKLSTVISKVEILSNSTLWLELSFNEVSNWLNSENLGENVPLTTWSSLIDWLNLVPCLLCVNVRDACEGEEVNEYCDDSRGGERGDVTSLWRRTLVVLWRGFTWNSLFPFVISSSSPAMLVSYNITGIL